MEIINITEEQRNNLCNELARLTFELRKNKSVTCIYFAPYKGFGNILGNVLDITIVRNGSKDNDLDKQIKEYNLSHQEHDFIREFGFKILLETDIDIRYTLMALNPSECTRSKNLMNSVILYDESGKFTQIKEKITSVVKKNGEDTLYYYYDNLAEVFPPLDETLDDARANRDTQAVKEFTRTKLFHHIIDM